MNAPSTRLLPLASIVSALFLYGLPAAHAASSLAENLAKMEAQSPIDITAADTKFEKLSPMQFNLSSDTTLSVINNGSPGTEKTAARANVVAGAGSVTVDGDTYQLAQFHFHTPAEHLENGKVFPMEMHLVFEDARNNILVVGRWIEVGASNAALEPIFSDLPKTTTQTHVFNHFDLNALLPTNMESFRYDGSLTTPPFSEGVKWIDLAQPLQMSAAEINAYSSLFPNGDAREIQDLNGRIVLTDVPGFAAAVPEPETYAMLLVGLGLIGFVANRKNKGLGKPGLVGSIA
ncbi:carbonic anhydrase family protein [Nitrosospira briensis]|uniref:carbonic anhydrase family protein n=1 Tax=Nitrosospira briensis TaxID=35799 RepID=UPI000468DD74|nr:carbonic anhydrase family protein [Nitrosospira briensis]